MTSAFNDAVSSRIGAWHQSGLDSLINGCARQYGINKLGVPQTPKPNAEAGTGAHAGIEAHELTRKEWFDSNGERGCEEGIPIEEMYAISDKHLDEMIPLMLPHHYPLDKKTGERITDEVIYEWARNAIYAWYYVPPKGEDKSNREWLLDYKPLEIEPYFKEELVPDALPIAGWTDGVYERLSDGKIIIVDEKTAKDFSRWKDGHRLQATVYAVAIVLSDVYKVHDLADVEFWYLINRTQTGKTKTFERAKKMMVQPDLQDVEELVTMIKEAERITKEEEYLKNPGWGPLCSELYCPFFKECMVTKEWDVPYKELKLIINNTQGDKDAVQ